jgi:protein Tex
MNVKEEFTVWDLAAAMKQISALLALKLSQVESATRLLDDGNTIPFIARYRKEATGRLDEFALRAIEDELQRLRELGQRKETVLRTVHQQGLLTPDLRAAIESCSDKRSLEDIYQPFKPKRRTRATVARERGLERLAKILLKQATLRQPREDVIRPFVDSDKGIPDTRAALAGACDIVAEAWADNSANRRLMDEQIPYARVTAKVKRGKKQEAAKFEAYFDYQEKVERIPSHRFLAIQRGQADGFLKSGLQLNDELVVRKLQALNVVNLDFEFSSDLLTTVEDCYQRWLLPAAKTKVIQQLKEGADVEAIKVFAKNFRALLLTSPAGPEVTLGIDPGFRTGCKVAVVDGTGRFMESATIFPTPPRNDLRQATECLLALCRRYEVKLIAIGNGTASRETDRFVADLVRQNSLDLTNVVVNESGASIYSASELAAREYPDLDVTVRGAISIAHRLQDPLAELVKIDAKSIGVGQYQHDVNQPLLQKSLDREVESCVNSVGVDVNLASASLLAYVAGIGPKIAENIVRYRDENGVFPSRKQLLKVPKLGKRAFEQAAGFMRIRNGDNPLDDSAVHPESYFVVEEMARRLQVPIDHLVGNHNLVKKIDEQQLHAVAVGRDTLADILDELARPGRDPRKQFKVARFSEGIRAMTDLKTGMTLEGTVTNVTKFGAFVDIGVHQDGLIHVSEIDHSFVVDPSSILTVGDIVRVKVLDVDLNRKRIALSRKQLTLD